MKQIIELDKEDIKRIIAKEFDIEEKNVSVSFRKIYRGLGIYEHQEYEVYATINK